MISVTLDTLLTTIPLLLLLLDLTTFILTTLQQLSPFPSPTAISHHQFLSYSKSHLLLFPNNLSLVFYICLIEQLLLICTVQHVKENTPLQRFQRRYTSVVIYLLTFLNCGDNNDDHGDSNTSVNKGRRYNPMAALGRYVSP